MIRCTIELLPGGSEERKKTLGIVEIANVGGTGTLGDYWVIATKTVPFAGALKATWRRRKTMIDGDEDEEVLAGRVYGFHRRRRGIYDLLYRALRDLVGDRNPPREGVRG